MKTNRKIRCALAAVIFFFPFIAASALLAAGAAKVVGDLTVGGLIFSGDAQHTVITKPSELGPWSVVNTDNLYFGLTGGNVGIGTMAPTEQLEITGNLKLGTAGGIYQAGIGICQGFPQVCHTTSERLLHNSGGTSNIFVGRNAGTLSITGTNNTATGANALSSNTIGSDNIAIGFNALTGNTAANKNIAIGNKALATQSFANNSFAYDTYNIAIGYQALYSNQPEAGTLKDRYNTAVGTNALYSNLGGYYNTALGNYALSSNTIGYDNTAVGKGAMGSGGSANVGSDNTAIGVDALGFNNSGSKNVAIGSGALYGQGYNYLNFNNNGAEWDSNNTAVGYNALFNNNPTASNNGNLNTAIGHSSGFTNTTGNNNTFIGVNADATTGTLVNATAIGYNAKVSQSNSLILGNAVWVGIGTSAPTSPLQVVGDIRVGTASTNGCIRNFAGTGIVGSCSSDQRLKTNIQPFEPTLDKLVQLQPVYFNWKTEEFPEYHFGQGRNSGLIAQEVEKVLPDLVAVDERGYKMVNYSELPLLLLAAVRELQAENASLKSDNKNLRSAQDELKDRLERVEKLLTSLKERN